MQIARAAAALVLAGVLEVVQPAAQQRRRSRHARNRSRERVRAAGIQRRARPRGQILLDVYEKILTKHGLVDRDHRWRVIHAQVVHPDDVARFGRLRLVADVNPYHVSDDMRWMEERIGAARARGAYAFRKLKDAGAVLIFGSDSPGTNAARYYLSPVCGLCAAVTRQTLDGEPRAGGLTRRAGHRFRR